MALFKKDSSETAHPTSLNPGSDIAPASGRATAQSASSSLGPTLRMTGEISGEEDISIHGTLEGKIRTTKTVTIGETGSIKAEIHGGTVVVMGTVQGNITATEKVLLRPTARVTGNITCASFTVNEGASFEGNINMKQGGRASQSSAEEKADKSGSEEGGRKSGNR